MRHLLTASLAILATALALPVAAQTEEKGVPILQAPYHLPVFKNEYVTMLNVYVPPGRNTGYHTHTTDSVSVNVEEAQTTNQNLGDAQPGPVRPRAEASRRSLPTANSRRARTRPRMLARRPSTTSRFSSPIQILAVSHRARVRKIQATSRSWTTSACAAGGSP
jgi:hypothetical protein